MKPRVQLALIALVIIVILIGEAIVYVPQRSTGTTVVIKSYPSPDALIQALADGEVDVAPLENAAPQTLLQLKSDPNLNVVPIGNFGFTYIGFNLRNSPLKNQVFREAMLYGFNRERAVNNALAGYGETLNPGLFSSAYAGLGWRNESIDSYPYDPAKASELLDSAGYTQSSTGVRVNPSTGQQLRTMFIFSKLTDPDAVAAGNLFAQDMQAIGLPIISFPETNIDFYSQVSITYYFDLYIETVPANAAPTWLYDLFAGIRNVYPAPLSTNLVGYNNSTFNANAKQLMTASNLDVARQAAFRCQEQLSLDLPALPVYSKNLLIVEQKGVFNITPITGSIPDTIAASLENTTGTVRIGEVGGLSDVNPATPLGGADSLALRLITTPLLTRAPNGLPQPGLVDRWEMSDNSTTLTLTVNQGSGFQEGSPTTAHDLVATMNWLLTNTLPSSPLYATLKSIRGVTEADPYTVRISLKQSNYFAVYQMADLFALPANSLPQGNGPLALLLSGALQSSGPFELERFVQGAEADLRSKAPIGGLTLAGVQGQDLSGYSVGGSQIQLRSQPLNYGGQLIENATFTALIQNGNGTTQIPGVYVGLGVYEVNLNLNVYGLSLGNHVVTTELYGQLPTGVILQFSRQDLVVHPPQFLGQIVVYFLAIVAVCFVAVRGVRGKRRAVGRGRTRGGKAIAKRRTVQRVRRTRNLKKESARVY